MTSIDTATTAAVGVLWFVGFAAVYLWTALALAAVFRKSGEEAWRAWVPILNQIVLFRLGGVSPLFLLFYLIVGPGALVVWVFQIIACHRINAEFGLGGGMTVLAALLLPVWASIVGFGSSRWVGEEAGPRRVGPGYVADDRAVTSGVPLPPAFDAAPAFHGRSTHMAPADPLLATSPEAVAPPAPAPGRPLPFAPTAPAAASSVGPVPPRAGRSESPVPPPLGGWAPPPLAAGAAPEAGSAGPPIPVEPLISVPSASAPTNPVTAVAPAPEESPFAPSASRSVVDWSDDGEAARPARGRSTFSGPTSLPPGTEDTGDVTGTVEGAFAPLSALSPAPEEPEPAPAPTRSVTRQPAGAPEPWAPSRSPLPESDAFPDTSGPVSAIVGAPDAGSPRSALSSVSAQNRRPQIPDDPLDETIIARRRRTEWSLIPPGGEPIAIGAEVVLLGRRPAHDPAHPGAQLISIDEGTVSKTHARLILRSEKWYVTDLDSTNGVVFATLMGTEVEATPGVEIEAGDRFLLGDAEIRLVRSAE